ncbi:Rv0340 family IniB-related protein [Mycobacterium sp. NPDC051804]|uniref:Rv0340 family IniB-related protein n=1 Tax=Mycobacterium sp. NPDC051804 TaxID=3364295 RepID=UPI00379F5387
MANSLLDFVMSLVRDPDAAARYAENPDQAIFDANLTNVTSADVSNLIPVVTESLGAAVPSTGTEGIIDMADNVWASGAATAAFDAFDDQVPVQAVDDVHTTIIDYVDSPDQTLDSGLDALHESGVPGVVGSDDGSLQFDQPVIDDLPVLDLPADGDLSDTIIEVADMDSDPSGYDIF